MNAEWKNRYEVATDAALKAGAVALEYFPDTTSADFAKLVERKADDSPVTIADRAAEQMLRNVILRRFPDDAFVGEEFGETNGTTGYRWIVDPIDGTRSFIRGIPMWATLVGLEYRGELIVGIAVEPVFGNTYRAMRGHGAFKNEDRICVSKVDQLADAILCTCDLNFFDKYDKMEQFLGLSKRVHRQRGYGDYFGFTLVAQGSADVMLDIGVHSWDVAAVIPLVEEAGGKFTDWSGRQDLEKTDVLASNGLLHEAALGVIGARP